MTGPTDRPGGGSGAPVTIGDYRVVRRLGAGGMGEVFLAEHPRLPRRDAIKVLSAALSGDEQFAARFRREADVLAGLQHPNIVMVHDRGEHEGRLWLAMEYVDGADAAQVLADRGPMPAAMVAGIVEQVGSALDAAWETRGLTHRDVKPANILLGFRAAPAGGERLSTVKLVDFGIAKTGDQASSLTATGVAVGTTAYLSPEAVEGKPLDNGADLYSLACTAFELLTGSAPYGPGTPSAIMIAHLTAPVPDPGRRMPGLPAGLAQVFRTAMAKRRDDRYATCADFAAAFRGAITGSHPVPGSTVPGRPPGTPAPYAPTMTPPVVSSPGMLPPPQSRPPMSPPPMSPPPMSRPVTPVPARGSGRGPLIGALAAVVVLLLAVAGFLAWNLRGDDGASTGTVATPTGAANTGAPNTGAPNTGAGGTEDPSGDAAVPTLAGTDRYGFVDSPARCGGGEQLVLAMRTSGAGDGSKIVICELSGGYTYHGARASGDQDGLTRPARSSGTGYVAQNTNSDGTTVYRVQPGTGLTVVFASGKTVTEPQQAVWTR